MRILQVCSATELGGGEIHVADLTRALANRGHALYLAVRPESPLRDPLAGTVASWHEFPLRNSLDLQSATGIADVINEHSIDIVHAHVGRDYLVAAMACKKTNGARLVLTRHHYLPIKSNAVYRWLLGSVAAVIAVSDPVRESIIRQLALPPDRVHVIPNWIDPERFHPIEQEAARAMFRIKGKIVAACIGQLTEAKGQEDFIRAAHRIALMRTDVEFLIVGDENDESEPFTTRLKELTRSLGIAGQVRFTGHVRHIPELLAAVDVVVVPSWDEGFSLVTLEALASRRAVLASSVGGIKGIVRDNVTGMLFPPRDLKSLTDKLLWMIADAPLRDRLAAQGQRDVYARFSREQVVDRIEALYSKLLDD